MLYQLNVSYNPAWLFFLCCLNCIYVLIDSMSFINLSSGRKEQMDKYTTTTNMHKLVRVTRACRHLCTNLARTEHPTSERTAAIYAGGVVEFSK